jgi:hypothetical protein
MGVHGTTRARVGAWAAALLVPVGLLAGCSDAGGDTTADRTPVAPSSTTSEPPVSTPELDSIAVIGHSGATGTGSDPDHPVSDAHANSWATGENPEVGSIYRRLLATHPALEGHNYNEAVNGTDVTALAGQASAALGQSPVPDLVLIQGIDNDMRCDGTDRQNQRPFARSLGEVIRTITGSSEGTQVYVVSQWATPERYVAAIEDNPDAVAQYTGTGLCDLFDARGRPRPAALRNVQTIFGLYWATTVRTCARIPRCFTDGGVEQRMVPTAGDLTADFNHLSISGHRKFARLAWSAMPAAIRDRP